jgi:hypothetical protein
LRLPHSGIPYGLNITELWKSGRAVGPAKLGVRDHWQERAALWVGLLARTSQPLFWIKHHPALPLF